MGLRHSAETKQRISEALKGANNPRFGVQVSEETRGKISAALRANPNHHFKRKGAEAVNEDGSTDIK
jgi:hypothetical protein